MNTARASAIDRARIGAGVRDCAGPAIVFGRSFLTVRALAILAGALGVPGLAQAAADGAPSGDSVTRSMARCVAITDATSRLACFDAVAAALGVAAASQPARVDAREAELSRREAELARRSVSIAAERAQLDAARAQAEAARVQLEEARAATLAEADAVERARAEVERRAESAQPVAKPDAREFGAEDLLKTNNPDPNEIREITAGVVRHERNNAGRLVVWLDNGQVWKQTDATRIRIPGDGFDAARVEKGWMGAHYMYLDDSKRKIRAERIR